ncbi:hypothetical protein G1H11_24150 [Phytoactinopolyspora alkaliphila]|uniref:Uncharacterized protein n=1 Tax=Phytoactinopolyspora alkaliphila TaxID=1783498 RepID=A0A6N9YTY3_9ACTN|nr:hypothetical protein [Phytoactinopolyspora alkaliphila]NED98397.1 hypothetical protein [Phytoactinopolyspora alkaliphila]
MRRRANVLAASVVACTLVSTTVAAQASSTTAALDPVAVPDIGTEVWLFDERDAYDFTKREPTIAPRYLVYPDEAVDAAGAAELIDELGLATHLTEYATRAWVINPTNGVSYDAEADLESYFSLLSELPRQATWQHTNMKVIGIGEGATFVNNVISQNSWSIAGIFTHGGSMSSAVTPHAPIPAYIHGDATAADQYVSANQAVPVSTEGGVTVYEDPADPLVRVVAAADSGQSLAESFSSAWEHLLSHNYRIYLDDNNPGRVDPFVTRDGFALFSYRLDELGVRQTPVTHPLGSSTGEYMWQEYIPESAAEAPAGTLPLIVLLHGTTDMPQHIAERGGWIEQVAETGAIMVSAENQGSRFGLLNFNADSTARLVEHLAAKYPQIDTGRVYAFGFSLGASQTQSWPLEQRDLFAAVAGLGAPFGGGDAQIALARSIAAPNHEVPIYMLQGVNDDIGQLPVSASSRSVYTALRAYGALNGVDVPQAPDLSVNPFYGIELDDQRWDKIGEKDAHVGTLSNDRGVVMKLAAVSDLAHVNYPLSAPDIWEFFEGYRRDTVTGELIFVPSFADVRWHYDQAVRAGLLAGELATEIQEAIDRAERFTDGPQHRAGLAQLDNAARTAERAGLDALAEALTKLRQSLS